MTMYPTERVQDAERAILISLQSGPVAAEQVRASMAELEALADTSGAVVVGAMIQQREQPNVATYVGRGKAQELAELANEVEATLIIVNAELTPMQIRNLEAVVDVKVIDRSQLILDIFAIRARSREAKLQVELAQCEYALPRLTGKGRSMSRTAAGIGARGPGETKLEMDRRRLRVRMNEMRYELDEIQRHRILHRQRRKQAGLPVVALTGYTNAGKSSLFNAICRLCRHDEADVVASENRLFKTLDTTTRKISINGVQFLLTDTVGFIQHLPHHLVAAFRSTLEEVTEADLLVHVVDLSNEHHDEHIRVVEQTLIDLGSNASSVILVGNKIDKLSRQQQAQAMSRCQVASATSMEGIKELVDHICEQLFQTKVYTFDVPYEKPELMARLYRLGDVVDRQDGDESWQLQVLLSQNALMELNNPWGENR